MSTSAVSPRLGRALALQARAARRVGWGLLAVIVIVPALWVLFLAPTTGAWATSFGSAVHDPKDFLITLLNGVTAAALYFVVASGFTLIFGLMRVVNMAHGAFFLFGGYVALKMQRHFIGEGGSFGLSSSQINWTHWIVPAVVGTVIVAAMGLLMQQLFLRWNQGQDLRQALITIAISIILADQMLSHFGGVAEDIAWPRNIDTFTNLRVSGIQYTTTRLFILGLALVIGALLWFWLKRTRAGMVIRAGVDDRAMVSALGINIQRTFAVAFIVGSALAGLGGVIGGSFASLAPGVDANWLLYSLVVVIIGGMGSLGRSRDRLAALGPDDQLLCRLLAGELHLLLDHLHVRARRDHPRGTSARTVREAGVRRMMTPDRSVAAFAVLFALTAPLFLSGYWIGTLLTDVFLLGVVASSLIFLAAYGGMVSLGQVALFGIAGFVVGNATTNGNTKGLNLGWNPWWGVLLGLAMAVGIGLLFGALASRSVGIYFLMITLTYGVIANLSFGQVTDVSGFGGISGIPTPSEIGVASAHQNRLYYVALGTAIAVYALLRYIIRTPFGLTLQGLRDDPVRMSSLGYNVALHRTIAFGFSAFIAGLGGVLFVWWNGHIDPASISLTSTINVLVIAVVGGLYRLEGAWVGALVFVILNNYSQQISFIGPRFASLIGAIFLVIVLVSPGGLMGLWESAVSHMSGRRGGPADRNSIGPPQPEPTV